ncbi:MAG: hypothetical protein FWD14_05635 [Treponema sp.]|nr:hypothetical protein [Treponema sp.]
MKKLCQKIITIVFVFFMQAFMPAFLPAYDFGLVTNINTGFGNSIYEDNDFDFDLTLWPRFSFLIGDDSGFIATAGLSFGVDDNNDFSFVPELLHTEFYKRFGVSEIKAGRFSYTDPLSFIVSGLFDGVQYLYTSHIGNFHAGVWYTGLLYKKNASITMTSDDMVGFLASLDFNDLSNTYFAPKRIFTSFGWEHPSLGELVHLNTALIAQVDLRKADYQYKYNNQYIILKAGLPVNNFLFEFGGSLELSQITGEENENGFALAAEAGFYWLFPGIYNSRLSFTGRITSGKSEGFCEAFNPITSKYYGYILKKKMSGISVFTVDYSRRLNPSMGVSVTTAYFVRNDLGTIAGYPLAFDSDGYFLGPDIMTRLVWSPASDLQFNLSGGMFLPALGNANPKEKSLWRAELTVVMSVY